MLLDLGFLPVSVDYRLCPEVNIREGPMTDACEAVEWARNVLPLLPLGLRAHPEHVVVIGYSTGGHLALTTAFTTLERGLKPPSAILGFYCPSNYSADWWRSPIYPQLAQQPSSEKFDLLEGVGKHAVSCTHTHTSWVKTDKLVTDCRVYANSEQQRCCPYNVTGRSTLALHSTCQLASADTSYAHQRITFKVPGIGQWKDIG
jgi:hypothetical protein